MGTIQNHGIIVVTVITVLLSVFGYYRSPITAEMVERPEEAEPVKDLIHSNVLEKGYRINGLHGPESIAIDQHGNIYTGLLDGRIVKIHKSATGALGEGLVEDIVTGPISGVNPIDGHYKTRPLGIRLHQGKLYIVDAYYGLYSVELTTKDIEVLIKPDDVAPAMKFPNDLDISQDGEYLYFTDTSSRWNLHELYFEMLEGSCNGRFFRYSLKSGKIKLLANKLCFPNGVQLLDDGKVALVSETTRFRVLFIDTRLGKVSNYVTVPGYPDNIRKSAKNEYWIALPIRRAKLFDFVMDHPMLRQIVTGILPMSWLKALSNTKVGMALKINHHGKIIGAIHDLTGKVSNTVSEILETKDGQIFAGSYREAYMVKCQT